MWSARPASSRGPTAASPPSPACTPSTRGSPGPSWPPWPRAPGWPAAGCGDAEGGPMLAAERKDLLVTRLRRAGKLIARDLGAELGLSETSVRRALRELAAAGLCQRVYGGALPLSPALGSHANRSGIAQESKR